MRRGEIYLVALDPIVGHEQRGTRPAVVVSADDVIRRRLVVTVVPGTNGANVRVDYPHSARIPADESGLPHETVFLGFQVRAVDRARFKSGPVGVLSPDAMERLDKALRFALGL